MPAKRKTEPVKEEAAEPQLIMADMFRTLLKTKEGAAWAKQILEEAKDPNVAKNRKHQETRQEAYFSFMQYLDRIPAGHDLPEGFHQLWGEWLVRFEEDEIAKLPPKDRTKDSINKWVKRAWTTTDLIDSNGSQTGQFNHHDQKPSAPPSTFIAIVVQQKGHWRMPQEQMFAATAHPFVRAFCNTLPLLPDKLVVLGKMHWALNLNGKPNSPEDKLRNDALYLNAALCGDIRECLPDELGRCIPFVQVPESAPLWELLNAAIGFGRMLQNHEVFGDGSVEMTLHKGIRSDIGITPREVIARLMDEYFNEKESEATSTSLLEWMGAIRPVSNGTPIDFPDHRGDGLRHLTWPTWDQTVKNEKRSR